MEGLKKITKTSVWVTGFWAEIRTWEFPNMEQKCYHLVTVFGVMHFNGDCRSNKDCSSSSTYM
jgi:hypothetical protein